MNNLLKRSYMGVVYLFLYAPILILVIYSFNSSRYSGAIAWEGFTVDWYIKVVNNRDLMDAVFNSLIVAFSAATIATIIGTVGAISLYRFNFLGKKFIYGLLYIVMLSPEVIMGISLLVLFTVINLPLGYWTLLITHVTFCIPFVVITIATRLSGFDKHLIEAAKDLGASELKTFLYIIIPMLLPAIAAGWLLSFTISMDDVIGSSFVSSNKFQTLPQYIYSMVRVSVKNDINALSTLIFIFSIVIVISAQLLLRDKRGKKRR